MEVSFGWRRRRRSKSPKPAWKSCAPKLPAITLCSIRKANKSWPSFPRGEATDARATTPRLRKRIGPRYTNADSRVPPLPDGQTGGARVSFRNHEQELWPRVEFGEYTKSSEVPLRIRRSANTKDQVQPREARRAP